MNLLDEILLQPGGSTRVLDLILKYIESKDVMVEHVDGALLAKGRLTEAHQDVGFGSGGNVEQSKTTLLYISIKKTFLRFSEVRLVDP